MLLVAIQPTSGFVVLTAKLEGEVALYIVVLIKIILLERYYYKAGTKVGPDQLGSPVRVGSTRINPDRLGS